MSKALTNLTNSPIKRASLHRAAKGSVSYNEERFDDEEFDSPDKHAKASSVAKGASKNDDNELSDEEGATANNFDIAQGKKRKQNLDKGGDDDEESDDDEGETGRKKRIKYWQREFIKDDRVRRIATGHFNTMKGWIDLPPMKLKHLIPAMCADCMNDPDPTIQRILQGHCETKEDLKEALELKGTTSRGTMMSSNWFQELVKLIKKPSYFAKNAMKNEREGKGPLRGLSIAARRKTSKLILFEMNRDD
mmetsp:Transcript_23713/g.33861  ORF Transcript_23713/g.33861 Transcript_23713/m.33861 type:complete len:249 (-) Transcript_23713:1318-2064(-)